MWSSFILLFYEITWCCSVPINCPTLKIALATNYSFAHTHTHTLAYSEEMLVSPVVSTALGCGQIQCDGRRLESPVIIRFNHSKQLVWRGCHVKIAPPPSCPPHFLTLLRNDVTRTISCHLLHSSYVYIVKLSLLQVFGSR